MIKTELLERILELLSHKKFKIRYYSAILLSNLLACNEQIVEIIIEHRIFETMIEKCFCEDDRVLFLLFIFSTYNKQRMNANKKAGRQKVKKKERKKVRNTGK